MVTRLKIKYLNELGQTVSFIDSLGQIFDVTVTKDTIVWEIMDEYSGGHFSWEQIREVRLQCNLSNFVMNLRVARNLIIVYHLNYYFWIPYDDKGNFRKGYYYDRVYQHIHNSLDINGKTYYDVLEYRFELRPWSLLYNKKEGILQMSDEDKVIFTIYK